MIGFPRGSLPSKQNGQLVYDSWRIPLTHHDKRMFVGLKKPDMTELSLRLGLLCDGLPGRHDVLGNRAAAGEDLRHGGARNTKRPRDGERLTLGWHGD